MLNSLLFPEMADAPGLSFPQPLSDRYKPAKIEDFAGLAETKKTLQGFAARPTDRGLFFLGPTGTGKTSMALALAHEVNGFIHHVAAGQCTVEQVRDLAFSCHYYPPKGYDRHVIIIDEADLMSQAAQNAILSYLDGTNTIPGCVWIFTANATDRLAERFVHRNLLLNFSTYAIQADAAKLLERVWDIEAPASLPRPNMARIIKELRGNIRAALAHIEGLVLAG